MSPECKSGCLQPSETLTHRTTPGGTGAATERSRSRRSRHGSGASSATAAARCRWLTRRMHHGAEDDPNILAPVRRQFRTEYPHSPSATRSNFAKRPTERNWPDRPDSQYVPQGYPQHTHHAVNRTAPQQPAVECSGMPQPLRQVAVACSPERNRLFRGEVPHFPDLSSRKLKEKAAATITAARVRKTIPGRSFRPAQAIRPRVLHLMVVCDCGPSPGAADRVEGG
jgi:hypothetical protein